ncbi:hypothetical protein HAX54_036406 [Datura stramonium]|uniref:Uncharacterized protein n=1 Tax=Datura stramonium TaxID=4076 RepID=A0ABS8VII1_DATST|nr:hypothetical protein [Datura stramonium]
MEEKQGKLWTNKPYTEENRVKSSGIKGYDHVGCSDLVSCSNGKGVVGPVARDVEGKSAAQVMCPILGQQRDENLNTKEQTLKVGPVLFTEVHILISNQFNVLRNIQDDPMLAEV